MVCPPSFEIDFESMIDVVSGAACVILAPGVLVLARARVRDRQHLAVRLRADHHDGRVLHRELRAEVAVDPLDRRLGLRTRPLGDEVVDVRRPVLDGRVADARAGLGDELDDRGVQRVGGVHRRRAPFDVVHRRALVGDDQRALELAGVLRVDAEVRLQRHLHVHARRHVDERAARLHTAELSAANLLSPGGMTVPKYCCTISGYSRTAVSMSVKSTPRPRGRHGSCGRRLRIRTGR